MGFYGFDNESDFNEYRLLKESEDASDQRLEGSGSGSGSSASQSSSSSYSSYSQSSREKVSPEEKRRQIRESEDAAQRHEEEWRRQAKKEENETTLIRFLFLMALMASITAGGYWKEISEYIKPYDPKTDRKEFHDEWADKEGSAADTERGVMWNECMEGNDSSMVVTPVTPSKNDWHKANYVERHEDDPDEYDDDDTWYSGEDDPDMYYEYDYHE